MNKEVFAFLAMVVCGGGISALFDLFRAARAVLKPNTAVTAVSDALFVVAAGFALTACAWNLNSAGFRFYELAGLALGGIFYFLLLSKWIFGVFLFIFENILKFVGFILKILLTPTLFLYKILFVQDRKNNKGRKDRTDNVKRR